MKRILLMTLTFIMVGMLSVSAKSDLTTSITSSPFDQVTTTVADVEGIDLNIYPNPTLDFVNVESVDVITEIKVINSFGQIVNVISGTNGYETIVELGELNNGVYFIIVNDKSVTKVIKQ